MANKLDNARFHIRRSKHLTEDEKELLLKEIHTDNVESIIIKKNNMILNNTPFICEYCGEKFIPDISHKNFLNQKYCSVEHQQKFLNRKRSEVHLGDKRKCSRCGEEFSINSILHIYCSDCASKVRSENKKRYKKAAVKVVKEKIPKVKVIKERVPKVKVIKERVLKVKKVLSEEDKLINKFKRRQKKIEGMNNLFLACQAQIKLDDEIKIHFPKGLDAI